MPGVFPSVLLSSLALFSAAQGSVWDLFNSELRHIQSEQNRIVQSVETFPLIPQGQILAPTGFHSAFLADPNTSSWVQIDLGHESALDAIVVVPAFLGTLQQSPGVYGFPPRFKVEVSNDPSFSNPTPLVDQSASDYIPLMAPIYVPVAGMRARYIRFTATRLQEKKPGPLPAFFCLGEILAFSQGANIAAHCTATASHPKETAPTWSTRNLVDGISALGLPVQAKTGGSHGWRSGAADSAGTNKWVQVDLGAAYNLQEVRLFPAHPPDFPERNSFGFPLRFRIEAANDSDFAEPSLLFECSGSDFPVPGDHPIPFPVRNVTARFVRVTATKLWERTDDFVFALGELEVYAGGKNVAFHCAVSSLDEAGGSLWKRAALTDGLVSQGALMDWQTWLRQISERRELRERFHLLENQRPSALAVAQSRAFSTLIAATSLIVMASVLAIGRSRERQTAALQALRERIARDLHDDLGSHLGSIRLMSELAMRVPNSPDNQESIQEIHRLSTEAAESMHSIVWLMRESDSPSLLRLTEAIRQSADSLCHDLSKEIRTDDGATKASAPLDFHRNVILIVRESLHNIARHAHATHLQIDAHWDARLFSLTITDDGLGFDPKTASNGNGLRNLQYRAASLGGTLTFTSAPGQGTKIHLQAPLS